MYERQIKQADAMIRHCQKQGDKNAIAHWMTVSESLRVADQVHRLPHVDPWETLKVWGDMTVDRPTPYPPGLDWQLVKAPRVTPTSNFRQWLFAAVVKPNYDEYSAEWWRYIYGEAAG